MAQPSPARVGALCRVDPGRPQACRQGRAPVKNSKMKRIQTMLENTCARAAGLTQGLHRAQGLHKAQGLHRVYRRIKAQGLRGGLHCRGIARWLPRPVASSLHTRGPGTARVALKSLQGCDANVLRHPRALHLILGSGAGAGNARERWSAGHTWSQTRPPLSKQRSAMYSTL